MAQKIYFVKNEYESNAIKVYISNSEYGSGVVKVFPVKPISKGL